MKTSPRGAPLFRSDGQAVVLGAIFLTPGGLSLSEIARLGNLSHGAVHHEVDRLERAGLVRSARVGRSRIVRPDESSPIFRELSGLVTKTLGPLAVLTREFASVSAPGVAYIFGSWARNYLGEVGPIANDVDVVVIGAQAPEDVYEACRRAESQLGMDVNPLLLTEDEWNESASPFLTEVKDGPLVRLDLE